MRPVQYTITPQDVEECASAVLQDAIGLKDRGRKCRAALLWHILLYAAAQRYIVESVAGAGIRG